MEILNIIIFTFLIQISNGDVRKSENDDLNRACIIRFLQIRGKIEEKIHTSPAPADLCRILLPLVYANHSERLCLKLWETKSIKAQCVFETLKKLEFIDLELKFEVYSKSKYYLKIEKRKKLHEVITAQREALTSTAKICKSDYTYGGLFDEILGINSSLIALQREYCLLKYALENKFLDLRYVNPNPRRIETSGIACMSIVIQTQNEREERLIDAFKDRKYSSEAITCLLDKYKDQRIFGWNLAKDFLHKLNVSENIKRFEDWRISKILSDFNKISSNCLYSFNWSLF